MKLADASTPVLVLHVHHGALGIARSLGRLGVPVYGMGHDPEGAASSSRYFRQVFPWRFTEEPPERSIEELLRVGRLIGRPTILFPGADDIVLLVAQNRDRLVDQYQFSHLRPELVRAMIDKRELFFLAQRHQIPTPDTLFPQTEDEVVRYAEGASFPIMLKGIDGTRLYERTGLKMVRVDNADDLLRSYRALEDPTAPNLMLQQFIPGGDDSVWMFNGYFDEQSDCLAGFTGRKLHQFPPYKGATSLGVVLPSPEVHEQTVRFAKAIGYQGILDIGFRFDPRDGQYKLLDPNPRVGCTFRLFVDRGGLDVVRTQYLHLTGQPVRVSAQADGRKWLVEDWEIDSIRAYRENGHLTLGQWLADVRGVKELAWWALDDPLPFLRKLVELGRRGVVWIRKRALRRPGADRDAPQARTDASHSTSQSVVADS